MEAAMLVAWPAGRETANETVNAMVNTRRPDTRAVLAPLMDE